MSFSWPSTFFSDTSFPPSTPQSLFPKAPLNPVQRAYSPSSFIDDIAIEDEEEPEGDNDRQNDNDSDSEELVFSEHDSDVAFINDSSDLSVYDSTDDEKPMTSIDNNDESELSDLPAEVAVRSPSKKRTPKATNSSSDDVTIVPTPPSKRKGTRRRTRAVVDMDTDEEYVFLSMLVEGQTAHRLRNAVIKKDDSMFSKGSAVKASTLPPALTTRQTSRETSSTLSTASSQDVSFAVDARAVNSTSTDNAIMNTGNVGTATAETSDVVTSAPDTLLAVVNNAAPVKEVGSSLTSVSDFRQEMQRFATCSSLSIERVLPLSSYMQELLKTEMKGVTHSILGAVLPALREQMATHQASASAQPSTPLPVTPKNNGTSDRIATEDSAVRVPSTPVSPPSMAFNNVNRTSAQVHPVTGVATSLLPAFQTPPAIHLSARPYSEVVTSTPTGPTVPPYTQSASNPLVASSTDVIHDPARSPFTVDGSPSKAPSKRLDFRNISDRPIGNIFEVNASSTSDTGPSASAATATVDEETNTPPIQCEVHDEDLQDPAIKHLFNGLCPLPGDKSVVPSYTPPSETYDSRRGGRVSFSGWAQNLKQFSVATLISAISFVESGRFINGSRISPAVVTMRPVSSRADNPINSYRVCMGSVGAVCVSVGMCTQSCIMRTTLVTGNRYRKSIGIVVHNQDWERLEAWTCVCFNEDVLYCQMSGKALVLTTRMSSNEETKEGEPSYNYVIWASVFLAIAAASSRGANQSMFKWVESPKKGGSPKKPIQTSSMTNIAMTLGPNDNSAYQAPPFPSLLIDETVPVYDARDREFDFASGLATLEHSLPLWQGGEIPVGAFIVAGYSMHSYMGKAQGIEDKVLHVSNNILWVIVCGVPA
ncbi:hypothetical protein R3P38DRAFT_3504082 [Favolaschia claudopus]|uniref:Uncharacterized protein n=1 Tax=Favolaschia claudopus TaxID=2862362 RepID=A0AAW0C6L0_9AGAR